MYHAFYGLSEAPFALNHDPKFVFNTAQQAAALRHLEDGLGAGRPLTVLLGNPGLGKTTILKTSLTSERCRHIGCVYLSNPTLPGNPLLETLLAQLSPPGPIALTGARLQALHALLNERRARGLRTALVIDESESLDADTLAEVSTLIGMQSDGRQLLPVVLAGLPALTSKLEGSRLRQATAAAPPFQLAPLDLGQTALAGILWRARAAGAEGGALFTREAVALIHHFSGGVPRTISVICDNTLLTGATMKQKPANRAAVFDVCQRLDLEPPASGAAGTAQAPRLHATAAAV